MQLVGESATQSLGRQIAHHCQAPLIMYLMGELGSGKTTFARGFIRSFGHHGIVKSPTFSLLEAYHCQAVTLYHLDLYRVENPCELEYIGIRDFFAEQQAIGLIEWPQRGGDRIPKPDLVLTFIYQDDYREVEYCAESSKGQLIIDQL